MPAPLARATALTRLSLSANHRLGPQLSAGDVATLNRLRALRSLSLDNCSLAALPAGDYLKGAWGWAACNSGAGG